MKIRSRQGYVICGSIFMALCIFITVIVSSSSPSWRVLSSSEIKDIAAFESLVFFDPNHGWAVAGALLETENGGKSWVQKLATEGEVYNSLTFVNTTTGWVVGASASNHSTLAPLILKTTDGGRRWQKQFLANSPQDVNNQPTYLTRVSFCDRNTGWAAGPNLIIRTVDGGETWQVKYFNEGTIKIADVVCIDANSSFAVGNSGMILRTNNGGDSWINQDSETKAHLVRVRSFGNAVWVLASDATVLHLPTQGGKVEVQKLDVNRVLRDIYFHNNNGWLVGAEGTIFYTDDEGHSWRVQTSPTANNLNCLFILDQKHGWAGGDSQTILGFSK